MIRECYSKFHIGRRVFGEKPPFEDKSVTSGICPECFELEMDKLAREGYVPLGWRKDWETFKKNKRRRNMPRQPKVGDFLLFDDRIWIIEKVSKGVVNFYDEFGTGDSDSLLIENLAPTDIQTWEAE